MNQADLHENYARCIRMCEGTKVNPWECVQLKYGITFKEGPWFRADPNDYTFALAIVENHPVFAGAELYEMNGEKVKVFCIDDYSSFGYSWNPPKPKTFALNGVEFPLPDADSGFKLVIRAENTDKHWKEDWFYFSSATDRDAAGAAIIDLLSGNAK